MSRFVLRDSGYTTFKKITSGKKWVGRVGKCEDGRFFGKIGSTFIYAATEREAFDDVVAKHLGYEDVQALQDHNRQVRHSNKIRRAESRAAFNQMMGGDYQALFDLLGKVK